MSKDWLQSLKVGDKVIVRPHYAVAVLPSIQVVTRITPTQIVVGATRYRKRNGREVRADAWTKAEIEEATPEAIAAVQTERKRQQYITRLVRVGWKSVSTDKLARIVAILDEEEEGGGE